MIKITAKLIVKEECITQFQETAAELVKKSSAEEGNITYTLNQSLSDPKVHTFIEIWKDMKAIELHNASEHFTTILPKLGAFAEETFPAELYKEVEC